MVPRLTSAERLFVALDFASAGPARRLVGQLGSHAVAYKVGLQLLTAEGPALVRELVAAGKQVFLDLKLFEIPNSVAGAMAAAGELGVAMVTVHASAGTDVLRAAVQAARPYPGLRVLALTVITSMDAPGLAEVGVPGSVEDQVLRLARLAAAAGCHGVVASPQEAAVLRAVLPTPMLIVTPRHPAGGRRCHGPCPHGRPAGSPSRRCHAPGGGPLHHRRRRPAGGVPGRLRTNCSGRG